MPRHDNKTKLEVVRLYRSGYGVADIIRRFDSKGQNVTRQFVRYWITQYEAGKFDIALINKREVRKRAITL